MSKIDKLRIRVALWVVGLGLVGVVAMVISGSVWSFVGGLAWSLAVLFLWAGRDAERDVGY